MSGGVDYVRIAEGEPLPDISAFRPFKALVVINADCSDQWQDLASQWLVDSGCLYMMAWGEGCSSWDDSVDWANLKAFDHGDIPDDRWVLTTWHEDEPLKEVFWYAQFSASHPEVDLAHALIVHISAENARDDMLALYEAAGRDDYLPD